MPTAQVLLNLPLPSHHFLDQRRSINTMGYLSKHIVLESMRPSCQFQRIATPYLLETALGASLRSHSAQRHMTRMTRSPCVADNEAHDLDIGVLALSKLGLQGFGESEIERFIAGRRSYHHPFGPKACRP